MGDAAAQAVFPTQVGMFRTFNGCGCLAAGFPHASGDVPRLMLDGRNVHKFSPRKWGCSATMRRAVTRKTVFPTQVGMFRDVRASSKQHKSFPHASGDVPVSMRSGQLLTMFSPRKWGCSEIPPWRTADGSVFPTQVGMFRKSARCAPRHRSFPHASGDVPVLGVADGVDLLFSPRKWGCSAHAVHAPFLHVVFPTQVGMFRTANAKSEIRTRFPHASGDVPWRTAPASGQYTFSPRKWGCSGALVPVIWRFPVFPTQVGMFRAATSRSMPSRSFPHASGDVPYGQYRSVTVTTFSPRKWGCSAARRR